MAKSSDGIYRKVYVRMWRDRKVRSLTPVQPSGQGLFLLLLTGEHTGPIPGILSVGRAAFAESLGWSTEAFDEAFGEVFREGLAEASWKDRVIYLPSALDSNPPANPNVVRSYGVLWREYVPECDLTDRALSALGQWCSAKGSAWEQAFAEAFPGAESTTQSLQGSLGRSPAERVGGNQKQEQEQEQEREQKQDGNNAHARDGSAPDHEPITDGSVIEIDPYPADCFIAARSCMAGFGKDPDDVAAKALFSDYVEACAAGGAGEPVWTSCREPMVRAMIWTRRAVAEDMPDLSIPETRDLAAQTLRNALAHAATMKGAGRGDWLHKVEQVFGDRFKYAQALGTLIADYRQSKRPQQRANAAAYEYDN